MQVTIVHEHLFKEVEYPLRFRSENLFKTVSILFSVLFIFLLLFKPFGVYEPEHKVSYFIICSLHAFSPALIVYVYFNTLNYVHAKSSKPKAWAPYHEYLHIAIVLLLTGIASFLLRSLIYNNAHNWSLRYLWEEIRNCYLAGSLFYVYLIIDDSYFRAWQDSYSTDLSFSPPYKTASADLTDHEIFIRTQVQQDNFSLNPAHLLFAKADGNYVELTICTNNKITTELKRISLTQLEAQITIYPFLFRCHRAYLVNLQQVKNITGNSQGYVLSLNTTEEKIPVSRAQLDRFNNHYEQFSSITGC